MYHVGVFYFAACYAIFTYSIVMFLLEYFPNNPKAIFFIGILLVIASISGMFINGIWQYLQKVLSPKTLMSLAISGLMIGVSIFLLGKIYPTWFASGALLVFAVCCYMWVYDLAEITLTTLILKRSSPDGQGREFAQKKIAQSIGMLTGVIIGGILSLMSSFLAQVFLLCLLFTSFFFFRYHFENDEDDFAISFASSTDWKDVLLSLSKPDIVKEKIKGSTENLQKKVIALSENVSHKITNEVSSVIQNPSIAMEAVQEVQHKTASILNEARLILLDLLAEENEIKRESVPKRNFYLKEIFSDMGNSFSLISKSFSFSARYILFLSCLMVIFFSFWDTMAITYQPIFLQHFKESLGFFTAFILFLFILPIFLLQYPFAILAEKFGDTTILMLGLFISGFSLIMLGLLESVWGNSITVLILSGLGNSIGYAAAFASAQSTFIAQLRWNLQQSSTAFDDGAIAATLQLALNIGNIFGQLFGGVIFALLGFYLGFLLIGVFLMALFFISLFFVRGSALPTALAKTV